MELMIETTMICAPIAQIEIPEIKSWSEIEEWYVKWDTLHYTLDGEEWKEIELNNNNTLEYVDWKRPAATRIYKDDGGCFGEVLAED